MANRYYGDFRSIDTSVDPNGQRYRAVIFTNYDGGDPYLREAIIIERGEYDQFIGYRPMHNRSITMADNPFTVTYEGDAENIYKPYRCSTATINFRQSDINLNFLNSNGTSTLVLLLKWNNDVVDDGNRMRNTATGQTITKKNVAYNDFVYFSGYYPWEYDAFCYDVEWVGFSTPETFSMDYSHVTDTFTLNAQDAFSTLQYKKYDWVGNEENTVVSFADTFFDFLQKLGTYRKIYVTDTIKFPDVANNVLPLIYSQQNNNFDEDRKPTNQLDTLTQILTYLNLTAIPYKNSLILTTPNAITEGWNNYYVYALPYNGYVINWPAQGAEYTYTGQEYLSDNYIITADSFADGGTTISTCNIYNSVTANVDEYGVELMLPDITDNNIYNFHQYDFAHDYFFLNGSTRVYWVWEHDFWHCKSEYLQTYQYNGTSTDNNAWFTTEVDGNPNYGLSSIQWKPTSAIVDDGGVKMERYTTVAQSPYNPSRKIYFYNPNFTGSWAVVGRNEVDGRFQTMLYSKTKDVVFTGQQYMQITGSWVFYVSNVAIFHTMPTTQYINQYVDLDVDFAAQWAYIRAKVKCCGKWLKNTSSDYGWQDTETDVKLYYQIRTGKAHGVQTDFQRTYRNFDGIVVPLPVTGDAAITGAIEIWLSRPLGCGTITSSCATLSNFAINVIPSNVVYATGTKIDEMTDTEFKTEIDENNIGEYTVDDIKLSSDNEKGARFSQVIRDGYRVMGNVYNVATGNYYFPEQHITNNIANQYSTPTINLQMTVHNKITPYSRIQWPQMAGKTFIPDSIQINYEYETQNITITEIKTPSTLTTTRRNTTRNYRRNNDLLIANRIADRNVITLQNPQIMPSGTFTATDGYIMYNGSETEVGNITLQSNFNTCNMQLSVPNDMIDEIQFTVENGALVVTTN